MTHHLARFLLHAHGADWPDPGEPFEVRADHVLLDERSGTVALLALEAMGAPRVACELALVVPRDAAGPDELEDLRYLQSASGALGLRFARPGAGPAGAVHRRRFAQPGRLLASAARGAAACGALATLAWPVGTLECAGAMAGAALRRARPAVLGARLEGALEPGAGGADLARTLAERLGETARGTIVEFHGPGVATLAMADRLAVAALLPELAGALAALFPSDDRTRAWLRARGRDADWRRLEGAESGFDAVRIVRLEDVVPVPATERLRIGAHADDDAVRALAAALAGRTLAPGVTLELALEGRAARAALEPDGAWAALIAAGARTLDPGAEPAPADASVIGGGPDEAERERTVAAFAARALQLPPAEAAGLAAAAPLRDGALALAADELLDLDQAPPIERGGRHVVPTAPPAFEGAVRGEVLLDAGDGAEAARLLPWGPRVAAARADGEALARLLFRDQDPAAAARARALGGGVVIAGDRYGGGAHAEDVARAHAALGVRVVIADSYGAGQERALALHGVLPLRFRERGERGSLARGDEIEIPGLPDVIAPGGRATVRQLTRGLTLSVRAPADPATLGVALSGGLLRAVMRAESPAGGRP